MADLKKTKIARKNIIRCCYCKLDFVGNTAWKRPPRCPACGGILKYAVKQAPNWKPKIRRKSGRFRMRNLASLPVPVKPNPRETNVEPIPRETNVEPIPRETIVEPNPRETNEEVISVPDPIEEVCAEEEMITDPGPLERLCAAEDSDPVVIGVLTEFPADTDALRAGLSESGADLIELRLDHSSEPGRIAFICSRSAEVAPCPLIATLRHKDEGGQWRWSEVERRAALGKALPSVNVVDIEMAFAESFSSEITSAHSKEVIVILSKHDFDGTPDNDTLSAWITRATDLGADVCKIACAVRDEEEARRLAEVAGSESEIAKIVIPISDSRPEYRLAFPLLGSTAAYATITVQVAPGQLPVSVTKRFLAEHSEIAGASFEEVVSAAREWIRKESASPPVQAAGE